MLYVNVLQKGVFCIVKTPFLRCKNMVFAMQKRTYCFSLNLYLQK